jgi:hypothetical protein
VEYLLREVLYEALPDWKSEKWTVTDFCVLLSQLPHARKVFTDSSEGDIGRVPLYVFLSQIVSGEASPLSAPQRIGISSDIALPVDHYAVWLLRELQASAIARKVQTDGQ